MPDESRQHIDDDDNYRVVEVKTKNGTSNSRKMSKINPKLRT